MVGQEPYRSGNEWVCRSQSSERYGDPYSRTYYLLDQNNSYPVANVYASTAQHPIIDVQGDHAKLIREIGTAGMVLVKNVNNTLPLKAPRFVSIFGYDAEIKADPWTNPARFGGGYEVNFGWNIFNGTMMTGDGSGSSTPRESILTSCPRVVHLVEIHHSVRYELTEQTA